MDRFDKLVTIARVGWIAWGAGSTLAAQAGSSRSEPSQFVIQFDQGLSEEKLNGRVFLMFSKDNENEPRFQINDGPRGQQIFGLDVNQWQADEAVVIDAEVLGYPTSSLKDVPTGEYWVQGLFHHYETFHRSDGHVIQMPMDRGEGQRWNRAPGNFFCRPQKIFWDSTKKATHQLLLDQKIAPIPPPQDTRYIKHIKIQSQRLSEFWGRPMELGAVVLLPEGWEEHPNVRYPLIVNHGHFPYTFPAFVSNLRIPI